MEEKDEQLEKPPEATADQSLAENLLTSPPFPDFAESFLGKDLLNEFYEIMENSEVIECDMLYADGEINKTELLEYITLLPIYHETRIKLKNLVQKIIDKLKDNINYYLGKSFDNKGKLKKTLAIIDLMNTPQDIFNSQIIKKAGYRNARIEEFIITLTQTLFYEIAEVIDDYPQDKKLLLTNHLHKLLKFNIKKEGNPPDAMVGFEIAQRIHGMLKYSIVPPELMFPDGKIEINTLEEETELNFLKLRDLSESRKIERYGKDFHELRIEIFGDEYHVWEEYKPINICMVRIILDNHYTDQQKMPYEKQNPSRNNRTELVRPVNRDSFDLFLDRANGELYPCSSTISMSRIFQKEAYIKFKYTITKLILEYLQNKKEDLPQILKKIQEKEEAERETARLAEVEKARIKAAMKEQYAYRECPQQEENIQEEAQQQEQAEASEKTPSSVYKRFINGKRLRRALEILLGPPTGQTGSHIKFKSKKDGNNYPIAIHPGTDVGVGLLTKCLKNFGITPEELEEIW